MLATNRCKNGPKSTIKQSLSPGQEKAVDDGRGYIGQYRQQLCSTIPFTTKSNKKRISRSNSELSQALTSPCFWNRLLAIHPVRLVTFLLSRAFHIDQIIVFGEFNWYHYLLQNCKHHRHYLPSSVTIHYHHHHHYHPGQVVTGPGIIILPQNCKHHHHQSHHHQHHHHHHHHGHHGHHSIVQVVTGPGSGGSQIDLKSTQRRAASFLVHHFTRHHHRFHHNLRHHHHLSHQGGLLPSSSF